MKKQIMSIAASAAIFTTGAMAFDMNTTGRIVADITKSTTPAAIYTNGIEADANLTLSTNRQGNALIYPAYRSGDGWSTKISLRNTKNVAILAKAVVYAKSDSRELGDFNLYLSPNDVATFTIKDGHVTSTDGSIASKVRDPIGGLALDSAIFADEEAFDLTLQSNDKEAGYVAIYAMAQQSASGATVAAGIADAAVYHDNHQELFQDYRRLLDVCREQDFNTTTPANWRTIFTKATTTSVTNGTAVDPTLLIKAPNVDANCTANPEFTGTWTLDANFTTASTDAFFGEVLMTHEGDKRSLLLPATALSNYTTGNQIMLWTEGEYAAIQDRRITGADIAATATYNVAGIDSDALAFVVNNGYFTFEKDANEGKNDYAFLVTQPMKRALVMAGDTDSYWTAEAPQSNTWGYFTLKRTPWTEDEGTIGIADIGYIQLNSPLEGSSVEIDQFSDELATFNYDDMVNGVDEGLDTYGFKTGATAGYIDMQINGVTGLPAIITQMSSDDVDGEAQINWIYSATN